MTKAGATHRRATSLTLKKRRGQLALSPPRHFGCDRCYLTVVGMLIFPAAICARIAFSFLMSAAGIREDTLP